MSSLDRDSDREAERKRIIRSRNRVVASLLVAFVILIFAISLVRMH